MDLDRRNAGLTVTSVHPRRVAVLSVHTSPLEQPGTGDAGGLNVYVQETSKRLAELGVTVEVFTRKTSSDQPPVVTVAPGVTVRHLAAGPYEALDKADLPAALCGLTRGVLAAEAAREPGAYDLVHSHYWLSGQVGFLAAERWGVPLVHTAHTLAKVKNLALAGGDDPEPVGRLIGEEQVVLAADRLLANTDDEARQLVRLYGADPHRIDVVPPGVDLEHFRPVPGARVRLGLPPDALVLLFVGRLQPLKAPDVLLRAAARLDAATRARTVVVVVGGPSGNGQGEPAALRALAAGLGLTVRFEPPAERARLRDWYCAADVVAVPSHNESFGLVALEAQACGTPVVATDVGGLRTTVRDGVSGLLVSGHDPDAWAAALLKAEETRAELSAGARAHAAEFSWTATAAGLLESYRTALRPALAAVAR
jgi:D-inositol-3-phosphate glycosyltransferase